VATGKFVKMLIRNYMFNDEVIGLVWNKRHLLGDDRVSEHL
jgi:hypothetical protein